MSERKLFPNSVVPLPANPGLTPEGIMVNAKSLAPPTDETLDLHFALATDAEVKAKLQAAVARGEVVPAEQIDKMYTATPEDVATLSSWLTANGYQITQTARDGIHASATASKIGETLDVNMVPVTQKGITYMSAQNAPSLPVEVGKAVLSINGLQPYRQMKKHLVRRPHPRSHSPADDGAVAATPAVRVANTPPYLVSEILKAYNANGLGLTGKGQTIAILIDTFPADADLLAFWAKNGLPVTMAQIQKINVPGGSMPAPTGEETLDASWSSGIAPGASIRIYASGSLLLTALDKAFDRIIADLPSQPGMRQLSISLGLSEALMPPGEIMTQQTKLLHLAAAGVNVFVSSGDDGSNPDGPGPAHVEYGAADASVVGVGGTTLRLNAGTGAVTSENGWTGSGGGMSTIIPRPVWQTGRGVPHGHGRVVPDVSCAADPNTSGFVVLNGHETGFGGTSWAAPTWAGFCALINEARKNAGKPALGFLNPNLYKLNGTPAFRDIIAGSNGVFHCGSGLDEVTGLGSPNVRELIARLA